MVQIKSIFVQTLKKEANAHFSFKCFLFVRKQQTLSNVSPFLVAINANTRSKLIVKPSDMSSAIHTRTYSVQRKWTRACKHFQCAKHRQGGWYAFSPGAEEKRWAKTIKITVTHSPLLAIYFATYIKLGLCSVFRPFPVVQISLLVENINSIQISNECFNRTFIIF